MIDNILTSLMIGSADFMYRMRSATNYILFGESGLLLSCIVITNQNVLIIISLRNFWLDHPL